MRGKPHNSPTRATDVVIFCAPETTTREPTCTMGCHKNLRGHHGKAKEGTETYWPAYIRKPKLFEKSRYQIQDLGKKYLKPQPVDKDA